MLVRRGHRGRRQVLDAQRRQPAVPRGAGLHWWPAAARSSSCPTPCGPWWRPAWTSCRPTSGPCSTTRPCSGRRVRSAPGRVRPAAGQDSDRSVLTPSSTPALRGRGRRVAVPVGQRPRRRLSHDHEGGPGPTPRRRGRGDGGGGAQEGRRRTRRAPLGHRGRAGGGARSVRGVPTTWSSRRSRRCWRRRRTTSTGCTPAGHRAGQPGPRPLGTATHRPRRAGGSCWPGRGARRAAPFAEAETDLSAPARRGRGGGDWLGGLARTWCSGRDRPPHRALPDAGRELAAAVALLERLGGRPRAGGRPAGLGHDLDLRRRLRRRRAPPRRGREACTPPSGTAGAAPGSISTAPGCPSSGATWTTPTPPHGGGRGTEGAGRPRGRGLGARPPRVRAAVPGPLRGGRGAGRGGRPGSGRAG